MPYRPLPSILIALAAALVGGGAQAQFSNELPTRAGLPSLAPLLDRITPAVVNIATVTTAPIENNPLARDPFFRRFFNLPDRPQQQIAAGSGVIVDAARGLVVTNNHVVKDAQQIIIWRQGGVIPVTPDTPSSVSLTSLKGGQGRAYRTSHLAAGFAVTPLGGPALVLDLTFRRTPERGALQIGRFQSEIMTRNS